MTAVVPSSFTVPGGRTSVDSGTFPDTACKVHDAFFSVIITTYNRAAFIGRAVQSVVDQTFQDWELIIVDDASTDETQSVLGNLHDSRIRVIRNSENVERSASRNRGIDFARGLYVCFLDSDDLFLADHLANLSKHIEASEEKRALFAASVIKRSSAGETYVDLLRQPELTPVEQVIRHHIPCISVAVHRDILVEEKFDPALRINEDVELFARIAARFSVHYLPERTVIWTIHDQNTRGMTTDYMTPQILALRMMFRNPALQPHLSAAFRREELAEKYRQRAHIHIEQGQPMPALRDVLVAVYRQPRHRQNRSLFGHFVYTCCPAGRCLEKSRRRWRCS